MVRLFSKEIKAAAVVAVWTSTTALADIGTAVDYPPAPYVPTRCNDQFPDNGLFVAVGGALWDNGAACGRKYRVRCISAANGRCTTADAVAVVVDGKDAKIPSMYLSPKLKELLLVRGKGTYNIEYMQN